MLTLGILDALCSGDLEHIDCDDGSTAGTYISFLQQAGAPFDYAVYRVGRGEFPPAVETCDAYLITGSIHGAYDNEPWIARLIAFIREAHAARRKLAGICFGHQVLAHALGGRAEKSDKGWGLGLHEFELQGEAAWMNGRPDQCALYFAHQDQVVQLPPGAQRLGGSSFCENALFSLDDMVLGIQGHPEFSREIMTAIATRPGDFEPRVSETAVRSLDQGAPDADLVAQWIIDFLRA